MTNRAFALLLVLCACGNAADGSTPESLKGSGSSNRASRAVCRIPGLERAVGTRAFVVPPGCEFGEAGTTTGPRVVRDATELASALTCQGAASPSFDFTTQDLYVVRYSQSPAYAGIEAVDDGTTLTFVTRFRPPCPDDPMPHPMDATMAFAMPKDAVRTYREASCSNPRACR